MVFPKSRHYACKQSRRATLYTGLRLIAPTDLERSELGVVNLALISDVDALDCCGGRTTVNGPFAGVAPS